jgi:hypothetical protein
VRLPDDRLLQEQMVTIYTYIGMLSRRKKNREGMRRPPDSAQLRRGPATAS